MTSVNQLLDEDPKITIRDLLDNNWDTSNTSISDKPRISTGWWDKSNDHPQVSVTNRSDAGDGVDFNNAGGKGVGRDESTTVNVTVFATRQKGEPNPKKLSHEMMQEVVRVINTKTDSIGNFYTTTVGTINELPPARPETPPAVFGYSIPVTGDWLRAFYQP